MFSRKQRSAILNQVSNFLESSRLRQIREAKREVDIYNPRFFNRAIVSRNMRYPKCPCGTRSSSEPCQCP